MRRSSRLAMGIAVALLGFTLPSDANASVDSATLSASVSPTPISLTTFSGVSLNLGFDAAYSGGFAPVPQRTTFHFDDDIDFDTTGLAQCPLPSITNVSTAQALAACGSAKVGSGSAIYNNGAFTAVVTAFNGTPGGGHYRLFLHFDINNESAIGVATGELSPSSKGADYGTQIDFVMPVIPGVAFTHFATTLDDLEPVAGHHFVSARCSDLDRTLNFAVDFTYIDSSTRAASTTQACPPTGQRAKALKKCKKKHSKKARKKCRKRAKQLPV